MSLHACQICAHTFVLPIIRVRIHTHILPIILVHAHLSAARYPPRNYVRLNNYEGLCTFCRVSFVKFCVLTLNSWRVFAGKNLNDELSFFKRGQIARIGSQTIGLFCCVQMCFGCSCPQGVFFRCSISRVTRCFLTFLQIYRLTKVSASSTAP